MLIKKQKQKTPPIKKPCLLTSASVMNTKIFTIILNPKYIAKSVPNRLKATTKTSDSLIFGCIQPIHSKNSQIFN